MEKKIKVFRKILFHPSLPIPECVCLFNFKREEWEDVGMSKNLFLIHLEWQELWKISIAFDFLVVNQSRRKVIQTVASTAQAPWRWSHFRIGNQLRTTNFWLELVLCQHFCFLLFRLAISLKPNDESSFPLELLFRPSTHTPPSMSFCLPFRIRNWLLINILISGPDAAGTAATTPATDRNLSFVNEIKKLFQLQRGWRQNFKNFN